MHWVFTFFFGGGCRILERPTLNPFLKAWEIQGTIYKKVGDVILCMDITSFHCSKHGKTKWKEKKNHITAVMIFIQWLPYPDCSSAWPEE